MSGEYREIKIVVTTRDVDQWHPGWKAAAEATQHLSYGDWVVDSLKQDLERTVAAWYAKHPDLLACEPDVV